MRLCSLWQCLSQTSLYHIRAELSFFPYLWVITSNLTIDWTVREAVRARLRVMVMHILRK
jgi:hypothetical protein